MKPAEQRTGPEKNFLVKTLKTESFFARIKQESEKDVFHKVFNEIRHLFYPKYKIIYKNGDILKKAMLVVEGEIWVLRLKKEKSDPIIAESLILSANLPKNTNEFAKFREYIRGNYPEFQIFNVLKEGGAIGLECLFDEKEEFMYIYINLP